MSVYRTTYKDSDGQTRKSSKWSAEVTDQLGKPLRVTGFSDRAATQVLEVKLWQLVALRATGAAPDAAMRAWIDGLPPLIRDRLATRGVLTAQQATGLRPLEELLDEWTSHMESGGISRRHVTESRAKAKSVLDGMKAAFWSGITAEALERHLLTRRRAGLSIQTSNHHLAAVRAFCNWAVVSGLASENPVRNVRPLNAKEDRRKLRLPLTVGQLRALLEKTAAAPFRFGMSGPERALMYRVACETGYRKAEILSLTVDDCDVADEAAAVLRLSAERTKNGADAGIPLRPELARLLAAHVKGRLPMAKVFGCPKSMNAAACLREDLAAAGVPSSDGAGREIDFHALRATFGTNLARGGVSLQMAQRLLRHSTPTLTANVYTVLTKDDERGGVMALPDVAPLPVAAEATGTDAGPLRDTLSRSPSQERPELPTSAQSATAVPGGFSSRTVGNARSEAGGSRSESNRPAGGLPAPTVLKTGRSEAGPGEPGGNPEAESDSLRLLRVWGKLGHEQRERVLRLAEELAGG